MEEFEIIKLARSIEFSINRIYVDETFNGNLQCGDIEDLQNIGSDAETVVSWISCNKSYTALNIMGKDGSLYTKLNRISNRYNFDNITQKEILRGMQALLRANYILYEEKEAQGMIDIKIGSISQYTISEDKKTDFIKIISAMYDCRMFSFVDGKMASNKKQLIKELGKFLNTEIDDYSPLLSAAKRNANYLEIFDKLKGKGEDYFNK